MTFRMYQKKMLEEEEEKKEIPIVCSFRHLGRRNVNDKIIHKRHVCERVSLPAFTVLSSFAPLLVMTELPLSASTAASLLHLFCANIKTGVVIIIIIASLDVPGLFRFCFSSSKQSRTNRAEQIRSWSSWDIPISFVWLLLVSRHFTAITCQPLGVAFPLFSHHMHSPVQSMPTPVPPTPTAHGICKKHHHHCTAHTTPLTPFHTFPSLFFSFFGGFLPFVVPFAQLWFLPSVFSRVRSLCLKGVDEKDRNAKENMLQTHLTKRL